MKMILMGTGTSHGVPVIGCDCAVCHSGDERDSRLRCSAYIAEPSRIVIDTGPEFRIQAIKFGIKKLDAVLVTHSHADHLHGLDDLRSFSHTQSSDASPDNPHAMETEGNGISLYTNHQAYCDIKNRFDYIFKTVQIGGGKPKLDIKDCSEFIPEKPLYIGKIEVLPVPLKHGILDDSGWLLSEKSVHDGKKHSIAYLTDCSYISRESLDLVKNNAGVLDHLVIDALRLKPHSTHFGFDQALNVAQILKPKHTWFTHLTHDLSHKQVTEYVNAVLYKYPVLKEICSAGGSVAPGYDGLVIETPV